MAIEINEKHQKADLSKIDVLKKGIRASLFGTVLALSLYSGSSQAKASSYNDTGYESNELDDMLNEDEPLNIADNYKEAIKSGLETEKEEITKEDLRKLKSIMLEVRSNDDLEWLNYCDNLENVMMILDTNELDAFKQVGEIKNLKSVVMTTTDNIAITKDNFEFLKKCENLRDLSVIGIDIEPGFIEELQQLSEFSFNGDFSNLELDYKKLGFLDKLSFDNGEIYDIAINFSDKDYEELINNGVEVNLGDKEQVEVFRDINNKLNNIVDKLNLNEESSDKEKLDAILIYTLDNLKYDEEVNRAVLNNEAGVEMTEEFYKDGTLYGALEKDSAICGNYTALVSALAKRVGLDANYLKSNSHAWNLIEVDGEKYYVDATWLDSDKLRQDVNSEYDSNGNIVSQEITFKEVPAAELIREGDTTDLKWYMTKVEDEEKIDNGHSHNPVNLPEYLDLEDEELEENVIEEKTSDVNGETKEDSKKDEKINNKKFEIKIGNKKYIIAGGALIGILGGLGGAVSISRKKKRKKELERRRNSYYNGYNSGYNFGERDNFSHRL